jgi:hypothetical protein
MEHISASMGKDTLDDGVYAIKFGQKVFANTGEIAVSAEDKKLHKLFWQAYGKHQPITIAALEKRALTWERKGYQTKIVKHKNSKNGGVIYRLMVWTKEMRH